MIRKPGMTAGSREQVGQGKENLEKKKRNNGRVPIDTHWTFKKCLHFIFISIQALQKLQLFQSG